MSITRKQFLVGGLASATSALLLDGCASDSDDGRDTFEGAGDGDGDSTGDGDGSPEAHMHTVLIACLL